MTTRNKRKLAASNKENSEENTRSNLAQNIGAPRSQEDYITQVSEEVEGRVTKRLSKVFSRTENRILGALAQLDDFLMSPLLPGHSGATAEPTRNILNASQGTNEDDSQNDSPPEAGLFHGRTTQNSGPEDGHDRYRFQSKNFGAKKHRSYLVYGFFYIYLQKQPQNERIKLYFHKMTVSRSHKLIDFLLRLNASSYTYPLYQWQKR